MYPCLCGWRWWWRKSWRLLYQPSSVLRRERNMDICNALVPEQYMPRHHLTGRICVTVVVRSAHRSSPEYPASALYQRQRYPGRDHNSPCLPSTDLYSSYSSNFYLCQPCGSVVPPFSHPENNATQPSGYVHHMARIRRCGGLSCSLLRHSRRSAPQ